ncbi:MAG: sigma-70 family RNA polymerase sigma factor [Candidatus Cloacimonetes bacterium]|nr:sigma-70 family RNA polymerase sigma factor [Candidatus Cloacimonadota bacterium]MDY0230061.1 sigma-70 family RNA polymerase sigma factor [Candidatus Cloacimonadaceae bacterium]
MYSPFNLKIINDNDALLKISIYLDQQINDIDGWDQTVFVKKLREQSLNKDWVPDSLIDYYLIDINRTPKLDKEGIQASFSDIRLYKRLIMEALLRSYQTFTTLTDMIKKCKVKNNVIRSIIQISPTSSVDGLVEEMEKLFIEVSSQFEYIKKLRTQIHSQHYEDNSQRYTMIDGIRDKINEQLSKYRISQRVLNVFVEMINKQASIAKSCLTKAEMLIAANNLIADDKHGLTKDYYTLLYIMNKRLSNDSKYSSHVRPEIIEIIKRIEQIEDTTLIQAHELIKIARSIDVYQKKIEYLQLRIFLTYRDHVIKIASQYSQHNLEIMDIIQEGNIGLHKAVANYRYNSYTPFDTYACRYIKTSIEESFEVKQNSLGFDVKDLNEVKSALERAKAAPIPINAYDPIDNVHIMELTPYGHWYSPKLNPVSLYSKEGLSEIHIPVYNAMRLPQPIWEIKQKHLHILVAKLLKLLNPAQAQVIKLRFGFYDVGPMTLEEVGSVLQLSRERIRQIEMNAIEKFNHREHQIIIDKYLDLKELMYYVNLYL